MVVGLRTKSRRGPTVHVDYLIHIQEIKPWPPTQALKTLRSVLIQWENGDRSSGTTNSVVPSLGSGVGEGKIEFNESFKLPVTLSIKGGGDSDTFQKNCLEFNLYEPRRDKTVKGQLLGTAIIDLADYGVIKETLSINAAVNCQRNFRNIAQPILYVEIERLRKGRRTSSSSRDNLLKEGLLDQNGGESDSALINREYAEEAELASFTDDDVSSHSSLNVSSSAYVSNGGSPPQNEENNSETVKDDTVGDIKDLSSGPGSPVNGHDSLSNFSESNIMSIPEEIVAPRVQSYSSYTTDVDTEEECKSTTRSNGHVDLDQEVHEKVAYGRNKFGTSAQPSIEENTLNAAFIKVSLPNDDSEAVQKLASTSVVHSQVDGENDEKACRFGRNGLDETAKAVDIDHGSLEDKKGDKEQENGQKNHIMDEDNQTLKDTLISRFQRDTTTKKVSTGSDTLSYSTVNLGMKNHILTSDRLKHVKSVRSPSDSGKSNGLVRGNQSLEEVKEAGVVRDALDSSRFLSSERKDSRVHPIETMNAYPDSKIQQLEHRIKILEGELREAAAVEVALYSVVAEHGSSMSKVHAPARRLSRLYLHACKEKSLSRRANAARAAVSGLFLVAKACGNDVPRLTFWLSNSVLMRIIISQAIGDSDLPLFAGPFIERTGNGKVNRNRSSPLKWESSSSMKERINGLSVDDWEDPNTFTSALEKIEAWIFSRIIESVWWQTLTPHMQSTAAKAIEGGVGSNSSKCYRRVSSSGDQEKANLSLDLWKKAFQDARERLCPVRAGGHECGCLPVLTKLIMEQCVARLDVAMFNAILRESADEIPTDPVSDPISDPKALPIPAGEFSFGAGAQLKNAIGNWSRLLSDLFGMDDDVSLGDENDQNHDDEGQDSSFKSFHILNALSDLMMLPKDMLLSRSIRKEVCPTFGASLIKRIINSFVPDEFCPDPIPEVVLEALDSEDTLESEVEFVTNFPCTAAPTVYSPPATASIAHIVGEIRSPQLKRSPSSVLRKSYTSDDELDELDCPLTCIFMDSLRDSPKPAKSNSASKQNGSQNSVRYQLLREVWMDSI